MLDRRTLLRSLLAAPAIVAVGNIMPVRALILPCCTTLVIHDGEWGWKVAHRGTRLPLNYKFESYDEAVVAAREIDGRFDLDAIARTVGRGVMPENERRAIYDIQERRGGYCYSAGYAGVDPEAVKIIRQWQRDPRESRDAR